MGKNKIIEKLKTYSLCLITGITICAIFQYISNTYFIGWIGGVIATGLITIIINKNEN